MRRFCLLPVALLLVSLVPVVQAQELPSIQKKTQGLQRHDGFVPVYWNDDLGNVWLEVSPDLGDILYGVSLSAGLGSNDIGLDRNQLGPQRVVRFERVGRKVLMVARNLRFRANSENPDEQAAVRDAFAESVVWSFPLLARTNGRLLVDATTFVVRDAHGVVSRLSAAGQGTFKIDTTRSAPKPAALKAFPDNTELEARLTFAGEKPGRFVRDVSADAGSVTLGVRHSLIRLPGPGFEPRRFDPRSGYGARSYVDYAVPVGEDVRQRFISRHRLQKADPSAHRSPPIKPIVYYVDRGTPEPIRQALIDGASWWNQAFEAAGFIDGFRVEVLPEGADPLDVRFNMINWVHRSTRGWSYGSSVSDPRTGEIIKGHVLLGSLRVRQDYLIMEGLMGPYNPDRPSPDPMLSASLARIRQLSAHEVGHTLGLSHNYIASTDGRTSVMDYPAPLVTLSDDGSLRSADAYAVGIGAWDKVAIQYGYSVFADSVDESATLDTILRDARESGIRYLTDADARPAGAAHPEVNLWDNGSDAVAALREVLAVRRFALGGLGITAIRDGRPIAQLHDVLVPVYLYHRFQVDAAVKMLGGVRYSYALRRSGDSLPIAVPVIEQTAALTVLLDAVTPETLALPKGLRTGIPPRPPGFPASRELFNGYADPIFDAHVPAEVGAALVFSALLAPERMARLVYQSDFDATLPELSDMLATVSETVWGTEPESDAYLAEVQRIVQQVWTDGLLEAAARPEIAPGVRSRLWQHLRDVAEYLGTNPGSDFESVAHRAHASDQIDRFLMRLYDPKERVPRATTPPGSPIGSGEAEIRQSRRRAWLDAWAGEYAACSALR